MEKLFCEMKSLLDIALTELGVEHTGLYVRELERECPYRGSLWALTRMLDRYRIATSSVRVADKECVKDMAVPFLAEVSDAGIAVVTSADGDKVTYQTERGSRTVATADFIREWSGVATLMEKTDESAEPDLSTRLKLQRRNRIVSAGFYAAVALMAVAAVSRFGSDYAATGLLAVFAAGIWLSYLLLKIHLAVPSQVADRLCSLLHGGRCGAEAESERKSPRLFGLFDLSEAGMAFFAVNAAALLLRAPFVGQALGLWVAAALPLTLWSVYYQGVIRKEWCALCLTVMACVWLSFGLLLADGVYNAVVPGRQLFGAIAVIGAAYWAALCAASKFSAACGRRLRMEAELDSLRRFKFDRPRWEQSLAASAPIGPEEDNDCRSTLLFGNADSQLPLITVVSNPFCRPCARMHARLEPLLDAGFRIRYYFTYFNADLAPVNKRIVAAYMTQGAEAAWRLLTDWYAGNRGTHVFNSDSPEPLPGETEREILPELARHDIWRERAGIDATPTVAVGGKTLPAGYEVEDLLYLY